MHESLAGDANACLKVAACRTGQSLAGLWPVMIERKGGVIWLGNPGFGVGEEYSGPLIAQGEDAAAIADALLRSLGPHGDVLKTTVPLDNPVRQAPGRRHIWHRNRVSSPIIGLSRRPSFEDWLAGKSGSFRQGLRYDRRKLQTFGNVRLIDGGHANADALGFIDWLFAEKRSWLERRGKTSVWISNDRSRQLLRALFLKAEPDRSGVELWGLLVDDTPAAGAVCFRSPAAIELFMFGMSPAFAARSPGSLLLEDIARSAHARGRDFDFRITSEAYKARWTDSIAPFETLVVALTARGIPAVVRAKAHTWNIAARRWAKARVQRLRRLKAR